MRYGHSSWGKAVFFGGLALRGSIITCGTVVRLLLISLGGPGFPLLALLALLCSIFVAGVLGVLFGWMVIFQISEGSSSSQVDEGSVSIEMSAGPDWCRKLHLELLLHFPFRKYQHNTVDLCCLGGGAFVYAAISCCSWSLSVTSLALSLITFCTMVALLAGPVIWNVWWLSSVSAVLISTL